MSSDCLDKTQFRKIILQQVPIIDVRAPIEFQDGHIPGSVNLPIMTNEERARVGTAFKQQGREAAIQLGHTLVSGDIKAGRIQAWSEFIRQHPASILTCFRGGLRSQIAQHWLKDAHLPVFRIDGGYKAIRNFLLEETERLSKSSPLLVVSGATGSGKSALLRRSMRSHAVLDLEKLANHRGSAFGGYRSPQPGQANFENQLAARLVVLESQFNPGKRVLVEDESRLVGSRAIPPPLFEAMRDSPLVLIEESIEVRVENTFQEYVLHSEEEKDVLFQKFKLSIERISKKLGGARAQELLTDIRNAETEFKNTGDLSQNKIWIQKILNWYYDPMYLGSLQQRKPKILFQGTCDQVGSYLTTN